MPGGQRAAGIGSGSRFGCPARAHGRMLDAMADFDPDIRRYYSQEWDEDARIRSGLGELELIRTKEIVSRYLPAGPLDVIDVGGASGVHSEWLLDLGHRVHLVDPVEPLIDRASDRLGERSGFTATLGDGRSIPAEDSSQDVVLLFGPLYHLTRGADRLRAWREARRVCRPGGVVFGAAISRFSSLFSGMAGGVIFDPTFKAIVDQDLVDGQHRNASGRDYFTTAYFHHPEELPKEATDAGLDVEAVLGVEGIAAWIPALERSWDDPQRRAIIVEAARAIESEPTLMGLGPHLIVVARKPE